MDNEFNKLLHDEKLASLRQLAYGASHEINNPLGNIASRAQMLAERSDDPELKRQLATIYRQAMRAHEMISDLMLFARPPQLILENCSPNSIASNIADAFADSANQVSICVDSQFDSIVCDATKLVEAISAVIQNAMEAVLDEQSIEVRVYDESADTLGIQVDDSGPGISADAAKHLFDPFYSGREAGRGLGFGLSKAWTIAQLHDGDLTLESKPDPGARFLFRLPKSGPASNSD